MDLQTTRFFPGLRPIESGPRVLGWRFGSHPKIRKSRSHAEVTQQVNPSATSTQTKMGKPAGQTADSLSSGFGFCSAPHFGVPNLSEFRRNSDSVQRGVSSFWCSFKTTPTCLGLPYKKKAALAFSNRLESCLGILTTNGCLCLCLGDPP